MHTVAVVAAVPVVGLLVLLNLSSLAKDAVQPSPEHLAKLDRLAQAYKLLGKQTWALQTELKVSGMTLADGPLACLRIADMITDQLFLSLKPSSILPCPQDTPQPSATES